MAWKKGETGNPNGRPVKNRTWTKILETAGNKTITLADGSKVTRKKLMAELIMQAITTGEVTFPSGETLELSPKDWQDMLWKAYGQVDGPPRLDVDVTSDGKQLLAPVVYLPQIEDDSASD